jgi:transcription factor CON7
LQLFNYVASHGGVGDNQLRSPDDGAGDTSFASGTSGVNANDDDDDDDAGSGGGAGNSSGTGPHKKRPRRRYDEVERLYACNYQGCPKSYGTLNHLNAHVAMQKHGVKRLPSEFKDMRKAWRKAKREDEQRRMAAAQQTVNAHAAMAAAALDRQRVNSHPGLMHGSMPPPALPHYGPPPPGMTYAAPSQGMPPTNPAQSAAFARALPMPSASQYGYAPHQMSYGGAPPSNAEYEYRSNMPSVPGGLGAYLMQGHHRGSI